MSLQKFSRIAIAATLAAGAAVAGPASAATSALKGYSSASVLNFTLTVDGSTATLINQEFASGSAPPNYSVTKTLPNYKRSTSYPNGLSLLVTATNVSDKASSAAASGGLKTSASSSIDSFSAMVSANSTPVLTITGAQAKSAAGTVPALSSTSAWTLSKAGVATPSNTSKFGTITITAPAFGINVTVSGAKSANTILYSNKDKSVVVTARRLTPVMFGKVHTGNTVDAIALHIANYSFGGHTINGDVTVGTCEAWVKPPTP